MIEIKNLKKIWEDDGSSVLEEINLTIEDGDIYALVGRSGAGKSTLLRCINGLTTYQGGSLTVDGCEIKDLKDKELREFRRHVGMIFQHFSLLERETVYQNIALPMQCWKYSKGFHPGSCSIAVKKAEKTVLDSINKVLETREVNFEYIPKNSDITANERTRIEAALSRTEFKARRIHEAYENGVDSLAEYKANKERLQAEQAQLRQELRNLLSNKPNMPPEQQKQQLMTNIRSSYLLLSDPNIEYELKGSALRSIVKNISFDRETGNIDIHYYV